MIDREKLATLSGDELEAYLDEICAYYEAKTENLRMMIEKRRKIIDRYREVASSD